VGGKDFPSANLFCKFGIVAGPDWRLLEGLDSGQTQVTLARAKSRTDNNPPLPLAMLAITTHHACFGADTTLLHLIRYVHNVPPPTRWVWLPMHSARALT
jgi:hypothetical protein